MSYHLGISHFHRQLSSPTASQEKRPEQDEDINEDSKDVLMDRLNDLVSRLAGSHSIEDDTVTAIHSEVDKIELILRKGERHLSPFSEDPYGIMNAPRDPEHFWGPSLSPSRPSLSPSQSLRMRLPPKLQSSAQGHRGKEMTAEVAMKIAKEAEELATTLSETVDELLLRKEEADVSNRPTVSHQLDI
jgi:hypothetical protein